MGEFYFELCTVRCKYIEVYFNQSSSIVCKEQVVENKAAIYMIS
jgi:hypothetical protein